MIETSTPRLRANLAALAALLTVAGCGFGSLSPNGDADDPGDDSSEEAAEVDPRVVDETEPTSACLNGDGPSAGPAPARLLTSYEYANTVRDLLGYSGDIADRFPAENEVHGFENNVDAHAASRLHVRKFMKAAETVSETVVDDHLSDLLPCDPERAGEVACGKQFVHRFLTRAFRRPPTDREIEKFVSFFENARDEFGFADGIEMTIQVALQSPQFLYRINSGGQEAAEGETRRLDDHEIASRLSYLLWASTPDAALLDAAADGELHTREQIERQARRMLEDPRAKNAVYQFHRQWLHLDDLDSTAKDAETFPRFDPSMTDDWKASIRQFVTDAYFGTTSTVETLLTSPKVYLTDTLATFYDREPKPGDGLDAHTFEGERRAGLLTQPALMGILANANQGSPIRRGVWVRERLLCQKLPPPPADANITPPDPDPNATTRERFAQHTEDPQCAGCHKLIDPIGFGFENYDGVGRFRARENGHPIDASGKLDNVRESSITGEFDGATELADRLARSDQVRDCLASQWFIYAMGRIPNDSESCVLHRVQQQFADSGGDLQELLVAIATSEAFRYRTVAQPGDSP